MEDKEDSEIAATMFKVSFIDGLPITVADIAVAMIKDLVIAQVYQYVLEGWPQKVVSDNFKTIY